MLLIGPIAMMEKSLLKFETIDLSDMVVKMPALFSKDVNKFSNKTKVWAGVSRIKVSRACCEKFIVVVLMDQWPDGFMTDTCRYCSKCGKEVINKEKIKALQTLLLTSIKDNNVLRNMKINEFEEFFQ